MTRDEAITKFTRESDLDDIAPAIVDGLEALGLLKLEEPTPRTEFYAILAKGLDPTTCIEIMDCMDAAGLKIVKSSTVSGDRSADDANSEVR